MVAQIKSAHGLKGFVKIKSFTSPPENIVKFLIWFISDKEGKNWSRLPEFKCHQHGELFLATLANCSNREEALELRGCLIGINRDAMEQTRSDEYLWVDLLGCSVSNAAGYNFGLAENLIETGSSDVMEIVGPNGKFLIPFSDKYLRKVDLELKLITVDWEKDWS